MTKREQRKFVNGLIENVRKDLQLKICGARFPREWDAHELRQLIADRFAECSWTLKENKRRYRQYKNRCLVDNLI